MRRSIAVAAALLTIGLAGCQQATQKSEEKVEAKVCTDLAAVGTALEQVAALKPTSTVGEATSANRALTTALGSLEQSEAVLEKLRMKEFRNQLKAFNQDANRIAANKKLTLEEAATVLKIKAQPVIAARRQVSARVQCPADKVPATAPAP